MLTHQTTPVGPPGPQWPDQSQQVSLQHPWLCWPEAGSLAVNQQGAARSRAESREGKKTMSIYSQNIIPLVSFLVQFCTQCVLIMDMFAQFYSLYMTRMHPNYA